MFSAKLLANFCFKKLRGRLEQQFHKEFYHSIPKLLNLHFTFSLLNFHEIQTSNVHNFLISSQNEMIYLFKLHKMTRGTKKIRLVFFFFFFWSKFQILTLFSILQFISNSPFNQTHISIQTYKTSTPFQTEP